MECLRISCSGLLLVFTALTLPVVTRSQVPSDTSAKTGSEVVFTCSGDVVEWRADNIPIYSPSFNTSITDTAKYAIEGSTGNFNLRVKNLVLADGKTYGCRTRANAGLTVFANLLVVDEALITVTTTPTGQLSAGQNVNFSCAVSYGAPTADENFDKPLTSTDPQNPVIDLKLDTQLLDSKVTHYTQPTGRSGTHMRTVTSNHMLSATDAGKSLICSVRSLTYTHDTLPQKLSMAYAPIRDGFTNSLNQSWTGPITVEVDWSKMKQILCFADGNPSPSVKWIPLPGQPGLTESTPSQTKGQAVLAIAKTPVEQKWSCEATNNQGTTVSHPMTLKITEGTGESKPKTENKVGLGVGLGIGLGIPILIGLIVLIVVLMRRKSRSKGHDVKSTTKPPPPLETRKPINEPHRPQRPMSGNRNGPSINPNPNPMYQPPVYPEQLTVAAPTSRTTPDRPGYGDLGVGHIHAGGSTPSLNRSYESSTHGGRESDYQPNGVNGRQGPNTSV